MHSYLLAAGRRRTGVCRARRLTIGRSTVIGLATCGLIVAWGLIAWVEPLAAESAAGDPYRGTASRAAHKNALASLPLDRLSGADRQRVEAVLAKTTIFRRLPTQVICCEPELYDYVADHPQILADIWQLLEIDDVTLTPAGDGVFTASDGTGTQGKVEYLYQDHHRRLIYAEGSYDGPLFAKPVIGSAVMLLTCDYVREPDGRYYITTRLDAFVRLDNPGAELLAKTFQLLVARVADMSFVQTAGFMQNLARASELNPRGLFRLADKLPTVDPQVKAEFVALTAGIAHKAAVREARLASSSGAETSADSRSIRGQNR